MYAPSISHKIFSTTRCGNRAGVGGIEGYAAKMTVNATRIRIPRRVANANVPRNVENSRHETQIEKRRRKMEMKT